ncbi:MAG: hypothetical protein P4L84_08415 [Isosphaeraceae bacterium]|nr:hypothetical protein [Isosphaeraceae bacterium]
MSKSVAQRLTAVFDLAFALTAALNLPWMVGQIARDDSWVTGLCFYIPSFFLATAFLGFCVVYALCKRWRRCLLAVALFVPPCAFVAFVENRFSRPEIAARPDALSLVHWNVGGKLRRNGTRRVLLSHRADAYVLSEIDDRATVQEFRDALGGPYQALEFGNMAVVAKGAVRSRGWLLNHHGAKAHSVIWEFAGHSLTLCVVDLPSNVLIPRAPLLREVVGLIVRERPDLVIGDFNAPRRSRALAALPLGYQHAYDTAGCGLSYTWPVPFPLYALDQCIHAPRMIPLRYELLSSIRSDHRRQVLRFIVGPAQGRPVAPVEVVSSFRNPQRVHGKVPLDFVVANRPDWRYVKQWVEPSLTTSATAPVPTR